MDKKAVCTTMYNRNYSGFDFVRNEHAVRTGESILSELLNAVLNRK